MHGRRPHELGRVIAVYRPRHPLGWLWLAVLPVPFALWAPGGPRPVRGLDPVIARKLAKGKLTWAEAGPSAIEMPGSRAEMRARTVAWHMSVRHPEHTRERLADVVRASDRIYPYQRPIRSRPRR